MDFKLMLLKQFYGGLPTDRVKIETERHGFAFLAQLLAGGAELEYGELTLSGLLHKYKLVNIRQGWLDALLMAHIAKECNVCLYFAAGANNMFCFNLDNNYKTNNTVVIPEMDFAVRTVRERLGELGCEPLIIASGRGYHLWCRLDGMIDNDRLYQFMLRTAAHAMAGLHGNGYDYSRIKFNLYPDIRTSDVVSLRLFGSEHAKNKIFSRVLTPDGLLDEAVSWDYFAAYVQGKTISADRFSRAYAAAVI